MVLWTWVASDRIAPDASYYLGRNIPLSQAGSPRPDSFDRLAQSYYLLLFGALLLATGVISAVCVLVPDKALRNRFWIYALLLVILLPASWYNFNLYDTVFKPSVQVALNLLIVFLGATTAFWIAGIKSNETDVRVLKIMAVFLLCFGAVFPMTFFTIIWFMEKIGMLTFDETKQIKWQHITAVGGCASAVIAGLNYRRELLKDKKQASKSGGTLGPPEKPKPVSRRPQTRQ
jgi:4-amino-4-deoxy-L-arabinose transferase-like glycosyltransferase